MTQLRSFYAVVGLTSFSRSFILAIGSGIDQLGLPRYTMRQALLGRLRVGKHRQEHCYHGRRLCRIVEGRR